MTQNVFPCKTAFLCMTAYVLMIPATQGASGITMMAVLIFTPLGISHVAKHKTQHPFFLLIE
jgi:hypothetical protein